MALNAGPRGPEDLKPRLPLREAGVAGGEQRGSVGREGRVKEDSGQAWKEGGEGGIWVTGLTGCGTEGGPAPGRGEAAPL